MQFFMGVLKLSHHQRDSKRVEVSSVLCSSIMFITFIVVLEGKIAAPLRITKNKILRENSLSRGHSMRLLAVSKESSSQTRRHGASRRFWRKPVGPLHAVFPDSGQHRRSGKSSGPFPGKRIRAFHQWRGDAVARSS